jgi:hypothetical protein
MYITRAFIEHLTNDPAVMLSINKKYFFLYKGIIWRKRKLNIGIIKKRRLFHLRKITESSLNYSTLMYLKKLIKLGFLKL